MVWMMIVITLRIMREIVMTMMMVMRVIMITTMRIFADNDDCTADEDYEGNRFARKGSLPTRALVSYPGSGNTWIRSL